MTITPEQFRLAFPTASAATVHTLFAQFGEQTCLSGTLARNDLTEPHVAAQFLAVCGLLSDGFTNFTTQSGEHVIAQSPDMWLWARACDWNHLRITPTARVWDFDFAALEMGVTNAHGNRLHGWRTLQAVCAALGVKCELEQHS